MIQECASLSTEDGSVSFHNIDHLLKIEVVPLLPDISMKSEIKPGH